MSKVVVTSEATVEVDDTTALIIKDQLKVGKKDTFITENVSLYDFDPDQEITAVDIS